MTTENIDLPMLGRIGEKFGALEAGGDLAVIYACESGSRAWGFPSRDSDYDVRFLYARPLPWYLAVGRRGDVVERPVDAELDLGGWDVKKALGLLRSGNAPLLEWLASPIVYRENAEAFAPVRRLVEVAFRPESVCHHYLAQARRMMARLEEASEVTLKTYFYAARALLAARWVITHQGAPPMNFWQLLEGASPSRWPEDILRMLANQKRVGTEKDRSPRLPELDAVLRQEHDELAEQIPKNPPPPPVEVFDAAFLDVLRTLGILPSQRGS